MKVLYKRNYLTTYIIMNWVMVLAIHSDSVLATNYVFPSSPPPIPYTTANGDNLEISSGTMQVAGSANQATINIANNNFSLLIDPGGTLSYNGSSAPTNSAALYLNGSLTGIILTNNGAISNGTAANAIYLNNTNAAQVSLQTTNAVTGPVVLGNVNFFIDGSGTVSGTITGTPTTNTSLIFGQNSSVNFTTSNTMSLISTINLAAGTLNMTNAIDNGSNTLNLNVTQGSTYNQNAEFLSSLTLTNYGTFNKNSTFIPSGNTFNITNESTGVFTASVGGLTSAGRFLTNNGAMNFNATGGNPTFDANSINNGAFYFYNAGAGNSGTFTGGGGTSSFNVGIDSFGTTYSSTTCTNFSPINGTPIFKVAAGTFTVANPITDINISFTVLPGATLLLNSSLAGSGTLTNTGTVNFGIGSTNGLALNNSTGMIIVSGANAINSGSITNTSTMTNAGSGLLTNTGTITFGTNSINGANISNTSGTLTVSGSNATSSGTLTNSSIMNGSGALFNTGSLSFTNGANNSLAITNQTTGIFNILGTTTNSATLTNNGQMLVSTALSGGTIINNPAGTLTFNGATNATAVSNAGTFIITGTASSNSVAITNTGAMQISATLNGIGAITNNGGTISLQTNANVVNSITNTSGTVALTGAATVGALSGSGTVNVDTQTLNATTYSNSGTHAVNTTNSTSGQVLTAGAVTLDGAKILVTSTATLSNSWTIITGLSISDSGTTFSFPSLGDWTSSFVPSGSPTAVIISVSLQDFSTSATGEFTSTAANILDYLAANGTNSAQHQLVTDFLAVPASQMNSALQQLVPNINADTANLHVLSNMISKVETRAAAARDYKTASGFAAGDISNCAAFWIGAVGDAAKQEQTAEDLNTGYRLRTLGMIMGIDTKVCGDIVLGLAFGTANANIFEMSNQNFLTRTLNFYLLQYGSYYRKSSFLEWVWAGATNKNDGNRAIDVAGSNLSAVSSYRSWLTGIKFNVGNFTDIRDVLRFSYLFSLQYSMLHQPSYNEYNSVAALHVDPSPFQNTLTTGGGFRLALARDPWLNGLNEIHALVTYDVVSPSTITNMNFVVGSPNFAISNARQPRLAAQFGADVALAINDRLKFCVSYDYEIRSGFYDHVGEVTFRYVF